MLFEIGCCGECLLAELTLPGLALVVDPLYVDPHVVSSHELLVTMRTRHIGNTGSRPALLTAALRLRLGLDT